MKFHQGVDLRAAYGQEVQAAGAGTVVFSGEQGGYGTSVVVEHQDGTRTRYAHLSAALVRKGDQVGAGEAGRAGRAERPGDRHASALRGHRPGWTAGGAAAVGERRHGRAGAAPGHG